MYLVQIRTTFKWLIELLICIEIDTMDVDSVKYEYNGKMTLNNIWYIYVPAPVKGLVLKQASIDLKMNVYSYLRNQEVTSNYHKSQLL